MSKDIPILGKIWLIFLCVVATFGVIANAIAIPQGIVYAISALACVGEIVGIIFMLRGKGIVYFALYFGCYLVNTILAAIVGTQEQSVAQWIGTVLGVVLNFVLTYLSAKKTFKKAE